MTKRIAVYTCVIGEYDTIPVERPGTAGVDFFVFSDLDLSGLTEWTPVRFLMSEYSPTLQNRFVKMHPGLMLPDYDYIVYVDGNVQVIGDISTFVEEMADSPDFVVGMYEHPFRNCIYSEGAACIKHSRDWFWRIARQLRRYSMENYPVENGLYEASVILSRRSEEADIFFRAWWLAYLSGSARDQLSLPFAAWRLSVKISNLGRSDFRYAHRFFKLVPHKLTSGNTRPFIARAVNSLIFRTLPISLLFGLKNWAPRLGEPDQSSKLSPK